MVALLPLLVLMQVPVPPPADRYSAAIDLWKEIAPSASEKQSAINSAIDEATTRALANIGISATLGNVKSAARWLPRFERLRPIIARRVPPVSARFDDSIAECVMKDTAYALSPAEIRSVQEFAATGAGKKIWSVSGAYHQNFLSCYRSVLNIQATDADYRAAGLVPPKPPKQMDTTTVN